jgi:hypothetical protein
MHCVGLKKRPLGDWFCGECAGYIVKQPMRTNRTYNVLSLFDGVGAGRQVLKNLGMSVNSYHAFECDAGATAVARKQHGDITPHGNVHRLCYELLRVIIAQHGPINLLLGGSPCQDVSFLNRGRAGILGEQSTLVHYMWICLHCLTMLQPGLEVHFLAENVNMDDEDRGYLDAWWSVYCGRKITPIKFNSNVLGLQSRPRMYWTNIQGANGHMQGLKEQVKKNEWSLGQVLCEGRTARSKKTGCLLATGQKDSPVVDQGGHAVKLRPLEVERVMGLRDGYTGGCGLSEKKRLEVLGNGWDVATIKQLLGCLR